MNNRELAILLWAALFFIWALSRPRMPEAFVRVLRAFFVCRIAVLIVVAVLWVALCMKALSNLHLWTASNLKTTLLWFSTSVMVSTMDVVKLGDEDSYFYKAARDNFKVAVVITFIAELYSLPLIVELIVFPILASSAAMQVYSSRDPQHAAVHKLTSNVLAVAGVGYVLYGIYMAANDFESFATWDTLREFVVPILLSLLFLPYLFMVAVLVIYERIGEGCWRALKTDQQTAVLLTEN